MPRQKSPVNGLLVFLIYGMFAVFSLLLVVIGAKVYRDVTVTGEENAQVRAMFSYVSNKVRMNPGGEGNVYLEERDGIPVLVLREISEGTAYETLIYCSDGVLRELYGAAGQEFYPESGEKITEVKDFSMEAAGNGQIILSAGKEGGGRLSMHLSCLTEKGED